MPKWDPQGKHGAQSRCDISHDDRKNGFEIQIDLQFLNIINILFYIHIDNNTA